MDTSFTIRPRPGVRSFTRDKLPARAPVETEHAVKTVAAAADIGDEQRERHPDHPPHDVVVDPESREVINRENDIRAQSETHEHPDQALARIRAYRTAPSEHETNPPPETHANIKA
jgi:hypothetical protein